MKKTKIHKEIVMGILSFVVVFCAVGCASESKENVSKNENVETETTIDKEKRMEVEFSAKCREIGWFEDVDEFSMKKISSMDELEAFRQEYEDDFIYAYEGEKDESLFYSILKGYNEQYLKNNTLFVTYYVTGVNGNSHFAGRVYLENGHHLKMEINSENPGSLGNCAMSGHLIIIGVSNDIVSKCDKFSSYYYDIYEDNYLK